MLEITPEDALIDVPRRIVVSRLAPGEEITLSTRTLRGPGTAWRSAATLRADAHGVVDLQRDAPVSGSYAGVSAMGLVWSQAPEREGAPRDVFGAEPAAALVTEVVAQRSSSATAWHGRFVQRLTGPGVTRREVRDEGLVGTLFLPAARADGRAPPAVLVLNGSGGGLNEPRAALYASHGYAALALGYFKAPGLSDYISNTRLEIFETALRWMHRTLRPMNGFVALSGQSRGGELVLLLGSLFPELVSAVIGYVPGAVVHSAQNACDPALGPDSRNGPAWLLRGQALPHLWQDNRTATWAPWDDGPPPRRHAHALLTALQDADAVARARIRVERIRGPVLLLSAGDDGSWPSSLYSRMVAERLAQFRHPHAVEHLDFDGAGHSIVFPYVPTTQLVYAHPVSGRLSTGGGTPAANAHADEASWAGVLRFLERALAKAPATESTIESTTEPRKEPSMSALHSATHSDGDLVDALVPLPAASPVLAVRHQRDKVVSATQGSYDALFDAALAGPSLAERLLVAHTVARLSGSAALQAHYRARLSSGDPLTPAQHAALNGEPAIDDARLRAVLAFTRTLTERPVEGDRDAVLTLPAAGLATAEVVLLAQLIAFVTYQVRVVAGLQAMAALPPAERDTAAPAAQSTDSTDAATFVHPANLPKPGEPVRVNGYTSETLEWKAWLPVLDLAQATPEQLAVLESSHPKAKTSDYYRVLAHQPRVLHERSQVFNAIMYAPGGLSRAERELASAAVSRINGCVYCASVHAQRFEQLTKRNDVIHQVFTEPRGAGTTPRERAVVQLAVALTQDPARFAAADLAGVRAGGLSPLELLDLVHAVAIFAWANRLMLNLGEPVFPA